jgi:hypothetical protein
MQGKDRAIEALVNIAGRALKVLDVSQRSTMLVIY